jgi:hypothetical protein
MIRVERKTWIRGTLLEPVLRSASLAVLLAGCGIDQGGVQGPGFPGGTTAARTLVVSGPITGFGSVLVNDLRLDTSTAQILIDGDFATEADLAIGQVIRAVAIADDRGVRAVSIEHEENIAGPIDRLDAVAGTLTVLGQTVIIDADTRFESSLTGDADLMPSDGVVVSGLTLPSGDLHATFVRRATPGDAFQITASITSVDVPSLTFTVGSLAIDYSQAILLQLLTGVPELGLIVEVKGTTIDNGVLVANEVRVRSSLPGLFTAAATSLTAFEQPLVSASSSSNQVDANFIGYITSQGTGGRISLADIDVLIGDGTTIVGGAVDDLSVGTKVQVEGGVSGVGQIQATRIKVL